MDTMRTPKQQKLLISFLNKYCKDKQCAKCEFYLLSDVSGHKICMHPNRPKRYRQRLAR